MISKFRLNMNPVNEPIKSERLFDLCDKTEDHGKLWFHLKILGVLITVVGVVAIAGIAGYFRFFKQTDVIRIEIRITL